MLHSIRLKSGVTHAIEFEAGVMLAFGMAIAI